MNFIKKFKNRRHSLWYHVFSMFCRIFLPIFQKIGINVTVHHYYSPIPDINETKRLFIKNSGSDSNNVNLNFNKIGHAGFIDTMEDFIEEFYSSGLMDILDNSSFRSVDAEVLYSIIRKNQPKKIIEVGGGITSKIISNAVIRNNNNCDYNCIEPYPTKDLVSTLRAGGTLIEKKVEDTDISIFEDLGENDILFIDSSHVIKPYNDLYFEFFRILPILKKGVFVHFHDIYLPLEYPLDNLEKYHYFWNEQYLLHTFMMFNKSFKIVWGGSYAHVSIPEKIERHFKSYNRDKEWPGSFWIRKVS